MKLIDWINWDFIHNGQSKRFALRYFDCGDTENSGYTNSCTRPRLEFIIPISKRDSLRRWYVLSFRKRKDFDDN